MSRASDKAQAKIDRAEERAEEKREQQAEDRKEDAAQAKADAKIHEVIPTSKPELPGPEPEQPKAISYGEALLALNAGKVAWRSIWTDGGYLRKVGDAIVNQRGHSYPAPDYDQAADDWNVADERIAAIST